MYPYYWGLVDPTLGVILFVEIRAPLSTLPSRFSRYAALDHTRGLLRHPPFPNLKPNFRLIKLGGDGMEPR